MDGSEYNFSSRFLHRIALQSTAMAEMSFDAENSLVKKKNLFFSDNPVFISGLARSGTTILMRYLYETGQFRSLTYLDMPFVLMPNLWKKVSYRKTSSEYKERAHQDGIMVSFESPEAFEEVFWRVFCGKEYIFKDRLTVQRTDPEILKKFRDYVYNVILSADNFKQTRYLSKNNNNILRLPYLLESFPGAKVVIPFREPLQHAVSLFHQHKHFSKMQSADRFSLDYMNWLGHFEFGLNQKPFHFRDDETFGKLMKCNKLDLDFWLLTWKNYYEFAAGQNESNILFFCYEDFCKSPENVLANLFRELKITSITADMKSFTPTDKDVSGYSLDLLEECLDIYYKLKEKFRIWHIKGRDN